MPDSKELVDRDSWRQRSELEKMADLSPELESELSRLDSEFWVSTEKLKSIVQQFIEELEEGLQQYRQNISMNISWVIGQPHGDEKGTFLALDLGGTNLRVCKITLHGNEGEKNADKYTLEQEKYKLPEELKKGSADELWTHIAESLDRFIKTKGLDKEYSKEKPIPFAFTFSYPATQHSIDHAILHTWTKGFDISGVEGEDVVAQLKPKLEERQLPIELICVVNDTVGAMVASAYNDPETIIGAIFGTGCNAAYWEKIEKIPKLELQDDEKNILRKHNKKHVSLGTMAINCEYGAFDNARKVLPLTSYDQQVDKESPRPGEQTFEKLSAGLYLGEIFRLIILDLHNKGLVFKDKDISKLKKPYGIDTGFLSEIEDDESPKFKKTRDLFKETLGLEPLDPEIELSRRLAELIAVRGARLCACGVAAICTKNNISTGHVAADGSVANKHPKFKRRWAKALGEALNWGSSTLNPFGKNGTVAEKGEVEKEGDKSIVKGEQEGNPIQLTSAEDGSGVGVAVVAAMTLERRAKGNLVGIRG